MIVATVWCAGGEVGLVRRYWPEAGLTSRVLSASRPASTSQQEQASNNKGHMQGKHSITYVQTLWKDVNEMNKLDRKIKIDGR